MTGDFDFLGVFLPRLLVLALAALACNLVLRWGLARLGAYRFVWHPALFDLALFVLLLGGLNVAYDWYLA